MRGQRGNSEALLLISSPLFNELSCETGSFSHHSNFHSPHPALSLSFPLSQTLPHSPPLCCSQPHPHGPPPHQSDCSIWLSLIPSLSEFHEVWFSGTSGCLLILDWLLSSFWLCEEAKGFYLHLRLGRNMHVWFYMHIQVMPTSTLGHWKRIVAPYSNLHYKSQKQHRWTSLFHGALHAPCRGSGDEQWGIRESRLEIAGSCLMTTSMTWQPWEPTKAIPLQTLPRL